MMQLSEKWKRHTIMQISIPPSSSTSMSRPLCGDPTPQPELLSTLWGSLKSPRKGFQICIQPCQEYCLQLLFAKSHKESGFSQTYSALVFSLYGHSS